MRASGGLAAAALLLSADAGADAEPAAQIHSDSALGPLPWAPPPADSPELLAFLRNTSRPKLAYSTYIGWCELHTHSTGCLRSLDPF